MDSAINMVPMIDLLISVIAFLLMTAVWISTGALLSRQPTTDPHDPTTPPTEHLTLWISADGVRVGSSAADAQSIANDGHAADALREALAARRRVNAAEREVWIQADGTVPYERIMGVLDVVYEVWSRGAPQGQRLADAVRVQML